MSGIEAVFGVVTGAAGLVSLSIELGRCAVRLGRIYRTAREAPRIIETLVFDLETMAICLRDLEQHRLHDTHSGVLLARCITSSQQRTAEIVRLVDKMERYMADHVSVKGKLYTAFKERNVKELLDDLEKAKSSLMLAFSMYCSAEQRQRAQEHSNLLSDIQAQLLTIHSPPQSQMLISSIGTTVASGSAWTATQQMHNTQTLSVQVDEQNKPDTHCTVGPGKRKNNKTRFLISLRFPTQLCSRVWNFAFTRAQCGWDIQLRTYNVVPFHSRIFRCCRNGDLAGVQRLITGGKGTPLDVYDRGGNRWGTLLEVEVCRYLLTHSSWLDRATTLSDALGYYALSTFSDDHYRAEEMYRLFIEAPGFDADLYTSPLRYAWIYGCQSERCLDIILTNQFSGFCRLPLEARFELAVQTGVQSCMERAGFLKCIGLGKSDQRLANLRSSGGLTILHYVARRLRTLVTYFSCPYHRITEWFDLGVRVLINGADPYGVAPGDDQSSVRRFFMNQDVKQEYYWQTTALLDCMGIADFEVLRYAGGWIYTEMMDALRIWIEMVQKAGLDLCEYGAKESQIWDSLVLRGLEERRRHGSMPVEQDRLESVRVERLVYGPTPADWSLKVSYSQTLYVHKLSLLPGAFGPKSSLPDQIIWFPDEEEETEGNWTIVQKKRLVPAAADLRDLVPSSCGPFMELLDETQDDSGVIMLMQLKT
ncbi:uncharacterized protein A1O5_09550 [Cladophialophora psammophila CBS 110553]|uniref:Fungal N-terminal domain-containing protein n=1 Tax=Cladophialophora psammophila CBS 110553 TaxID=1182543 RepID=W9WHB7_9EURO|nr:uncharacterized protein A1O5_09550 [Cladophialophora psammophila CBS 110553]EXJ67537.1 hypothetical protein A1O5_09550 [Cladophialophora psammophila CBS 110553]